MRHSLVVATSNRGKLEELRLLLSGLPLDVHAIGDVMKTPPTIVEDGTTFAENALKKAQAIAEATKMLSLGDDSGLEVDALDGRPGIFSARFAHDRATDAENNAELLRALDSRASTARFQCALALVDPYAIDGAPLVAHGSCEGKIVRTARGSGGFGYDPIFLVDGTDKTMAELTEEEKNTLSHRARALAALVPKLALLLESRDRVIASIFD